MSKVLCLGDSCADIIIPYGESLYRNDVSVTFSCGGSTANTAYSLGKLNVDVSFSGKAGRDYYGLAMKKQLDEAKVNTNNFFIDENLVSTQIMVVIDKNKERHPFLMPKENPSYLQIYPDELDKIDLSDTEYIITNGMMLFRNPAAETIADYLTQCHQKGIKILLDINYRIETIDQDKTYLDKVISISDYLLGSLEDDFLPLTNTDNIQDAVKVLLKEDNAIIVHNAEGSSYYTKDKQGFDSSCKIDVIDTLGAGDAFNAGFIYGLVHNMNIESCNRCGLKTAAYCVSHHGARNISDEKILMD